MFIQGDPLCCVAKDCTPAVVFASHRAARFLKISSKKAGDSDSRRYAVVQQIALYHHVGRVQAN